MTRTERFLADPTPLTWAKSRRHSGAPRKEWDRWFKKYVVPLGRTLEDLITREDLNKILSAMEKNTVP